MSNVFVDGQNVGTTGDYSLQALKIAQAGAAADVSPADQCSLGRVCHGA